MVAAKICGLTRHEDAVWAAACGAAAVGFIFVPGSKRQVPPILPASLADVLPPLCWRVGVFADQPVEVVLALASEARLDAIQLHGSESPEDVRRIADIWPVWRALTATRTDLAEAMLAVAPHVRAFVIDSGQGTGEVFDWGRLALLPPSKPLIVAGGLDSTVLPDLWRICHPAAVDASSRLESAPGIKDRARVAAFLAAAGQLGPLKA